MVGLGNVLQCAMRLPSQLISQRFQSSSGIHSDKGGLLLLTVLSVWPLSFLLGLTVLGAAGAGFQSRFLIPALPATAVLTAFVAGASAESSVSGGIVLLLVVVGAFHTFYYCILYPTLFADFELSIADIIALILSSPLQPIESRTALSEVANFMTHHGLNISTS